MVMIQSHNLISSGSVADVAAAAAVDGVKIDVPIHQSVWLVFFHLLSMMDRINSIHLVMRLRHSYEIRLVDHHHHQDAVVDDDDDDDDDA
jgi:hypothetical protein